jgi:hypothetical protein
VAQSGSAIPLTSVAAFGFMPSAPTKTKSKLHPEGYLTEREVKIIVNRSIRDDPGKVST